MRVLIADDSADARAVLREALLAIRVESIECDNGRDAVQLYAAEHPDVVLMDIRMPGMNGIDAVREILRIDEYAEVLMFTQYDERAYREESVDAGAHGYYLKHKLTDLLADLQLRAIRNRNGHAIPYTDISNRRRR